MIGMETAETPVARLYDECVYKLPIDTDTTEAPAARLYDGGFAYKLPIDTDTTEAPAARLYDGGFAYKLPIDTDTTEAPAARLYDGGFAYKLPIDTDTTEAPAARRAHARCAPQSLVSLAPSGAYIACARLAAAPSSPTRPRPHHRKSVLLAPFGRCAGCDFRTPARSLRSLAGPHLTPPQPRRWSSAALRTSDSLARALRALRALRGTRHRFASSPPSDLRLCDSGPCDRSTRNEARARLTCV